MQIVLHFTVGLAAIVCLAAQPELARAETAAREAQDTTQLASRLAGTWTGQVTNSGSARALPLTMLWQKAPDGHMTGTVIAASGAKYPLKVVWSSDTAFISESAPHRSPILGTTVVTRSLIHFKAHALEGRFAARPTTSRGRTLTGHFSVTRTS
jgi:hypothetical protein